MLQRMGINVPGVPAPGKTYPERSTAAGFGPIVAGGLYPRVTTKEKLRAPAAKQTPAEKENLRLADWEKTLGRKLPDRVRKASRSKVAYSKHREELKKRLGVKKLTRSQDGLMMLAILRGEHRVSESFIRGAGERLKSGDPFKIDHAITAIEHRLYWNIYEHYSGLVHHRKKVRQAQRAAGKKPPPTRAPEPSAGAVSGLPSGY
jgi:hypothetical protein